MSVLNVTGSYKYVDITPGHALVNGQVLYVNETFRVNDSSLTGAPGGDYGDYYVHLRPNRNIMEAYYSKNWEIVLKSAAAGGAAPTVNPDEIVLGIIQKRQVAGNTVLTAVELNRGKRLIDSKDISDFAVDPVHISNLNTDDFTFPRDVTVSRNLIVTTGATVGGQAVVVNNDSRLTNSRAPTGTAGGVLAGTYPNPSFAADMATQSELDTHANLTTTAHGGIVSSADARLSDARSPTGVAGGDLGGTYPNPTVTKAQAGFNIGGTNVVLTTDSRLADSRAPTGAAGGDLAGTYPNPTVPGKVNKTGDTVTGLLTLQGGVAIPTGAAAGKILTSNAGGTGTWGTPFARGRVNVVWPNNNVSSIAVVLHGLSVVPASVVLTANGGVFGNQNYHVYDFDATQFRVQGASTVALNTTISVNWVAFV